MVLITALSVALLTGQESVEGQVKLPLDDYVDLVERAEASERARRDADGDTEAVVAELVSQQTSIVWNADDATADLATTYEVELAGTPTLPVVIPVSGLVWATTIEPDAGASLQADPAGLRFVAPGPGRYTIEVSSRASIEQASGVSRLSLARFSAPVGEYELTMPAELLFRCDGAVIADEDVRDEGRVVRFALARGKPAVVEARRDLMGDDADNVLASAVVVTVIDLQRDGPERHDIVLYELSRGAMETFALTLPPGLVVERVRTDEGESAGLLDGRSLTVERATKLTANGFVSLTSHPKDPLENLSLATVVPRVDVRARYLALRSSIAADASPLPDESWLRVDLEDLPVAVRSETNQLVAAWRLDATYPSLSLRVDARPPASMLETVVHERNSLTLVTADGTLVHRDRFELQSRASAFRVRLQPGTTLWSVQVDDLLVRPIERDGVTLVPLSSGGDDPEVVEIVAVREQSLPAERASLSLALAESQAPVLTHTWRVMLPEGNLYRFVEGELAPVVAQKAPKDEGRFAVDSRARALGMGGSSSIWGRVFDSTGGTLPGTTVELYESSTGWSATVSADEHGSFWFVALRKGVYNLRAYLAGFASGNYEGIELGSGQNAAYGITLDVAGIEERISVTGPPPALSAFADEEAPAAPGASGAYRQQASALKQGLVGGVKPIPIVIPETGKILTLTGVLPPQTIHVELEVKPQ